MSALTGLICLLLLRASYVVAQSLCNSSNYLEVKEDEVNSFVCTGLTADQNVTWIWENLSSTCTMTYCNVNSFSQYFNISRPEATASYIMVNVTPFSDLDVLATSTLSCLVPHVRNDTCQLDVVYPAQNPNCQIEFNKDSWEVTGSCTVSKVRSRRNRYGCYLYQTLEQSSPVLVGNFTMTTTPTFETNYSSGECQIKTALPAEGKYDYSIFIIPGKVLVLPFFNGTNEIRRPSEFPQHDCPQYVTEGEDVNCLCFSHNLGLPPGFPVWKEINSSQLKINKVNRTLNGTHNTCVLMWNNTAVQSVTYTITVNCSDVPETGRLIPNALLGGIVGGFLGGISCILLTCVHCIHLRKGRRGEHPSLSNTSVEETSTERNKALSVFPMTRFGSRNFGFDENDKEE